MGPHSNAIAAKFYVAHNTGDSAILAATKGYKTEMSAQERGLSTGEQN